MGRGAAVSPDQTAVEAVAKALWQFDMAHGLCTRMDGPASGHVGEAKAAVEALTALGYANRADVAEECAQIAETVSFPFAESFTKCPQDYLNEAARRIREIGQQP